MPLKWCSRCHVGNDDGGSGVDRSPWDSDCPSSSAGDRAIFHLSKNALSQSLVLGLRIDLLPALPIPLRKRQHAKSLGARFFRENLRVRMVFLLRRTGSFPTKIRGGL